MAPFLSLYLVDDVLIYHVNCRFDMLFLGMGPDGHTASIFPNSKLYRLKVSCCNYGHSEIMQSWANGVLNKKELPITLLTNWYRKLYKMDSTAWFVGVDDSPKAPPQRITLTMPAINASANVAFICTGDDKATVLRVRERKNSYTLGMQVRYQ